MAPATTCRRCGAPIVYRYAKKDRVWCSKRCATYFKREERRRVAQLKRPRCVICDAPLKYGQSGTNLKSRTCGQTSCVNRAYNWFTRTYQGARDHHDGIEPPPTGGTRTHA